jgi:hypothetical protein
MTPPIVKIILVMYPVAVGVLWIATYIIAPRGFEFSFLRGIGAAFLMTLFGNASLKLLSPLIGDWFILVILLMYILVVRAVFRLAFWRSILIAMIYIIVVGTVYYFVFTRPAQLN